MRLVIIGAGGHGQVVAETALTIGRYQEILFLDDRFDGDENSFYTYGSVRYRISGECKIYQKFIDNQTELYPAFGNNRLRLEWEKKILQNGGMLATIIHPSASVSSSAIIEQGTVILANATVNVGTVIQSACIINCGAIVDHGCIINEGVHIDSGAVILAENEIPPLIKIDAGKVVGLREFERKRLL